MNKLKHCFANSLVYITNKVDCHCQLNSPASVIIHEETDSLIICDYDKKRVVRWPRQNGISEETIISSVGCWSSAFDNDGFLYVVDYNNQNVKRYRMGESKGILAAGGNGEGHGLDRLSYAGHIFVDRDQTVRVPDSNNHRVMKWKKDEKEGIVVAGGQDKGNSLTQLSSSCGISVCQSGNVYVIDEGNHRITH
ncbi:unnamed protein product [Rotaria magnacalcarata]|uniref:Uncharacterized protein n=1 Tax=Rotaria magnacalcarata TaxID=392030 RepID=A0A816PXY9_9BILA|nr:unnamed protein product [Rotaria magnacalcarata]CAF2053807.1 unnamed protein product [Rotaria magnacalcarata]